MKLSFKTILPIILISALLILLAGCVLPDESPGYTPGAISGTIARPEVCCGEPSESSLVGNAISPNICDVLTLCDPQNTADWYAWANVEVTLTTWVDCEEVELASTITDENGDYLFSNVPAGKNYIITAICPEEIDFKVKDVAEEVVAGETYDAGIADAESTVLALCLEGLGEICLDSDVLDLDDFRDHFKYNKVICEVCDKLAECLYAMPVWVCEITELCPGYTSTGDDDDDDDDDDVCPDPTANAGPDQSEEVCPAATALIDFNGSGTGTGTLSYSWNFDNGEPTNDSAEQSPQDVAFGVGTYDVTLTVTDDCGSTTDTMTVTITESATVAFTISAVYDFDEDPPFCSQNDTTLWWHEPCGHTQDRDYVRVEIIADKNLVGGDTVVLHFDKDKIQVAPSDPDTGDDWGFVNSNGTIDNTNGSVTFSGPLTVGNNFYAVFWKYDHDWGSGSYSDVTDTILTLSSNLTCPNYPGDFYIYFDDNGPVRGPVQ